MLPCKTVEDGVRAALSVYSCTPSVSWEYRPAAPGEYCDTLVLDGVSYPLFWWRTDTQIVQLRDLAPERNLCSMKLNRTCAKSEGLDRLLYRELDIAQLMLGAPVESLMCFRRENSMNMLATMENRRVAVFELAAVLHDGTPEQGRHIYWGTDGMASDKVVSQKIPSEAVYLFTEDSEKPETFNDIFLYMYGLNKTEAVKAAAIAEILMGRTDISSWPELDASYRRCIAAAAESARSVRRVRIEEVQA